MADTQTSTTVPAAYVASAVAAAAQGRGEPAWLATRREDAARAFEALPMPTQQMRPWKYTDLGSFSFDAFAPDQGFAPAVVATAPAGGFAGSIVDALADSTLAPIVERHLGALVPATEGKFTAANAALWTAGTFIYVPRGQAFEAPVTITVEASQGAIFPRMLVVTDAATEVTVIVRCHSTDAALMVSQVVEVFAGDDSNVKLVFDLDWGDATQEFTTVRSKTGRGADVQVVTLAIGGALVKQTLEGIIEGEGSSSRIRGVALGDRNQHFDFVTLQDHVGRKTVSDVQIKTALAGASRSIYYGVTRVEETGLGSAAEQENRNLLLSSQAKADSDPVLEILTNDVIRCGHGATVGPVDQEALFYLQSRGLDRRQAFTLLVAGFFNSVLAGIGDDALTEEVTAKVEQKLVAARI